MSAGFLGFENGQWKWQCLDCGKTFLGKAGDAKGAIEIHEADPNVTEWTISPIVNGVHPITS